MPLPSSILPRLGQLVRMLGSDQDHEALATVHALRRTLNGAGVDLHDLADAVEQPRKPRAQRAPRASRPPQAPQEQGAGALRWSLDRRITIGRTLRRGISAGLFSPWETQFAEDVISQILSPSRPRDLSAKQAEIVNKLLAKVEEASS